jgi:hypothetical protein
MLILANFFQPLLDHTQMVLKLIQVIGGARSMKQSLGLAE